MRSQIFLVFLIGLVATQALPVPEEADVEKSASVADIEAPEDLETKSIAQDEPVDLEPKADIQATESLEPKSIAQEQPVDLEPKADIDASDSLEPKVVLSVDNSLEPIAEQMRSAIGAANDAVNDIAAEVKGVAVRALDYAKELTAPLDVKERANIASSLAERALDVSAKMQADAKNLLDRAIQDTESLQLSGRSILPSAGDIVKILQEKYLTSDGKDLVRAVLSIANV